MEVDVEYSTVSLTCKEPKFEHMKISNSKSTVQNPKSKCGWAAAVRTNFVGRSFVRSFVRWFVGWRRSWFGIHSSFVVRRSSFVVRRSSFVVRRSSFVVRRSSFVVATALELVNLVTAATMTATPLDYG